MKSLRVAELLGGIETSIREISAFSHASDIEKSYLARFLVVFVSGIYEESIETIINEKVGRLNSTQVSKFIANSLRYNFGNPDTANIAKILKRFDESWAEVIKGIDSQSKDALDSIVGDKNALAHGGSCTVTLDEVIQYYRKSRVVIERIDEAVL